jgi:hypothetical protein
MDLLILWQHGQKLFFFEETALITRSGFWQTSEVWLGLMLAGTINEDITIKHVF